MKILIFFTWVLLLCLPLQGWAEEERFSVNLKDVDLAEFIDSVGRITDRSFMVDPRVRGRVTIRSQRELSADEIYQVFLSQLRVNGFAVVPAGGDNYKIVPEQTARLEPLPVEGTQSPNVDGSDLMATRVVEVQHSSAAQLVNILTPLMDRRIGVITHYEPSNLLILTDWGTNLERLTHLVRRIDTASSDDLEILLLEHASATEMEQLLNQLMRREGRGGQAPRILSDSRLNLLMVRGDTASRNEVKRLVAELDQPVERSANTQVFYLRHASAPEMVTLLQSLAETEATGGEGTEKRRLSIQAHEATNALVISGSPDQLREMRLIIDQLDIRRAQVLVEAIIVEVSDRQARELGVSWLFGDTSGGAVPVTSGNFGGGLTGVAEGYSSGGDAGALAALAGLQGMAAGVGRISRSGVSFAAILRALETETDANILSTPSLLTLDNAEASILVGQEVPFITGNQLDTNNNPFQTIQRREVGVRLQIKPQINDGDSVRLEILQEVSNVEDNSRGAADLITNKREISTTVMADHDDIIVLGGLIQEEEQEVQRRVPLLGSIPYLGALFRSSNLSSEKRNLMVFIRPQILHDRDALAAASSEKYRYMRAAHLLRRGETSQLQEWEPRTATGQPMTLEELFPARREVR